MESTTVSVLKGEKLKNSPQWGGWIKRLQQYARDRDVWELVNPDTPQQSGRPGPLSKPTLPKYSSTDDDEVKRSWRDQLDIFKIQHAEWERQKKGLAEVNEWIMTNLDPIHRDSLLDYYTPLERPQYLQSRFARSSAYRQEQRTRAYREELRMQWRRVSAAPPRKGVDIHRWLAEWNTLRERAVSLEIAGVSEANADFLVAVKDILPVWWHFKFEAIAMRGEDVKTNDLLESFRSFYLQEYPAKSPKSTRSKPIFPTLQGREEAKPSQDIPYAKRSCPCGVQFHRPGVCYIMNEAVRPAGWTMPKNRKKRLDKVLKGDSGWKQWIEDRIKEYNEKQKTSDQPVEKQSESASAASNISPEITALNARNAVEQLKSRWLLGLGSSVHVCNARNRFATYTPLSDATVETGDSTTEVLGYGTVELTGVDPLTGQKRVITLSDALYSPNFHTSLVSYGAMWEKGGSWDVSAECIKDSNGTPVVSMEFWDDLKLWVFDTPVDL